MLVLLCFSLNYLSFLWLFVVEAKHIYVPHKNKCKATIRIFTKFNPDSIECYSLPHVPCKNCSLKSMKTNNTENIQYHCIYIVLYTMYCSTKMKSLSTKVGLEHPKQGLLTL